MPSFSFTPPLAAIFLTSVLLFFLAVEIGFRLGRRRARETEDLKSAPAGVVTGSILGLTSFLLAITFGFAATNYADRRAVVLDEANAIGAAYLRADLMPTESGQAFREELLKYTRDRVEAAKQMKTRDDVTPYLMIVDEIHSKMWSLASELAKSQPTPTHALLVQSVNEVIDLHAQRIAFATRITIPLPIWAALFTISFISLGTTGYRFGISFRTRPELMPAMVIAFACVVALISDLNTPRSGFLQSDQQPMEDLLLMMQRQSL